MKSMSPADASAQVMQMRVPAPVWSIRRWSRRPLARWLLTLLAFAGAQAGIVRPVTGTCAATAGAPTPDVHDSGVRGEARESSRQPASPGHDSSSSRPLAAAASCGASAALPAERHVGAATAAANGDPVQAPVRVLTSIARAVPLPPPRSS